MSNWKDWVQTTGEVMDVGGVAVIVIGVAAATGVYLSRILRRQDPGDLYRSYRQTVGRAILLGLEILVAADIIRTVATTPSFRTVGVLGIIVAIRTILSMSLQVELEGRWPWQRAAAARRPAATP
jgi:uncharacterized membrane protein